MSSIERACRREPGIKERLRQELNLATAITLGAIALAQIARNSGSDPRDIAAYKTLRAAELDTYAYAKDLQSEGPESRPAANAVDKLGQDLSGLRGELEDKLDQEGYFNQS